MQRKLKSSKQANAFELSAMQKVGYRWALLALIMYNPLIRCEFQECHLCLSSCRYYKKKEEWENETTAVKAQLGYDDLLDFHSADEFGEIISKMNSCQKSF